MSHGGVARPRDFMVGGVATVGACLFSNPIEVVKTRMQLQGELKKRADVVRVYRNPVQAFLLICRQEGLRGIQKGLAPACIYQFSMNGVRLGSYNYVQQAYCAISPLDPERHTFLIRVLSGATSGALGALTGSPFYLIKTRMQATSSFAASGAAQYHYKSTWDGLLTVWRSEGVVGLFRGAKVACLRVATGSAVQLSTYDACKDTLGTMTFFEPPARQGILLHFASAMITGLAVTSAMSPADVMTTRIYNQAAGKELYSGILDCFTKIWRTEGLAGFYKGWTAHYLRVGPHTVLTFVFLEQLRKVFG
jgi:solute carrier family 25, member 34/35